MTSLPRRSSLLAGPTNRRKADLREILSGLRGQPRSLPCRFFYDQRGAELFVAITKTTAYYPTRTETAILRQHAGQLARLVGPGASVIEFGSGSGEKTEILLDALRRPAHYLPVDVSCAQLNRFARSLSAAYPGLDVHPICADYTQPIAWPEEVFARGRTVAFFPGSTIGNLEPDHAVRFLEQTRALCGPAGCLIIGVDLKKDRAVLEHAYNDPEGLTAEFNLNILANLNRRFDADFNRASFRHHAFYNEEQGRIEMHLVSAEPQTVRIGAAHPWPALFTLQADEPIVTEHSYKYAPAEFDILAEQAGYNVAGTWTDQQQHFAVLLLEPVNSSR